MVVSLKNWNHYMQLLSLSGNTPCERLRLKMCERGMEISLLIVFIIFLDCPFISQLVLGWKLATTFFKWAVGYSDYDVFLENDRGSLL